MAALKNKKHIFFDLDDTLWDFERNSGIVLAELFGEHGLAGKLKTDFAMFHHTYRNMNLELWSQYYKRAITKEFLRNHRFNLVFNKFGYDDYEEGLRITAKYLDRAPRGTHLKEGCREVLDYLKGRYQLHIITNGFREVQSIKIDGCGLRDYFSNIIISEEHDLVKPDERIFRLGESLASATKEDCVMIGDNFESDIAGGLNAGWEVIYFNPEPNGFGGNRISNLGELRHFF